MLKLKLTSHIKILYFIIVFNFNIWTFTIQCFNLSFIFTFVNGVLKLKLKSSLKTVFSRMIFFLSKSQCIVGFKSSSELMFVIVLHIPTLNKAV